MRLDEKGVLDWGHDYGGAVPRSPLNRDEFEHRPVNINLDDPLPDPSPRVNPLNISALRKLFETIESLPDEEVLMREPRGIDGDGFGCLPPEILQEILLLLPSPDVASLRKASPVFSNIGLPEPFWASRFQEGHEYNCIFECTQSPPPSWRRLHQAIRSLQPQPLSLTNRQRVWKLALDMRDMLGQMADVSCQGQVISSIFEPGINQDTGEWQTVGRGVGGLDQPLQLPCRALRTRVIHFDADFQVQELWVSFVRLGADSFISGLRFVLQDAKHVAIGYIHPDQEVCISFPDGQDGGGYTISGWYLALDTRGFKAIAVMNGLGILSSWVGEAENDIPRLCLSGDEGGISAVKIEFDVSVSRYPEFHDFCYLDG